MTDVIDTGQARSEVAGHGGIVETNTPRSKLRTLPPLLTSASIAVASPNGASCATADEIGAARAAGQVATPDGSAHHRPTGGARASGTSAQPHSRPARYGAARAARRRRGRGRTTMSQLPRRSTKSAAITDPGGGPGKRRTRAPGGAWARTRSHAQGRRGRASPHLRTAP
jgi:hypothetical protein